MMKRVTSTVVLLMTVLLTQAQVPDGMEYAVLPTPAEMKFGNELWLLPDTISIQGYNGKVGITLRDQIKVYSSILNLPVSVSREVVMTEEEAIAEKHVWDEPVDIGITFFIIPELAKHGKDYYSIKINSNGAAIQVADQKYLVYALQTLHQLYIYKEGKTYLPYCEITDYPDSPWRGLLLDVCRHFMPLKVLYRTVDAMSACKMNVLHLHLSDDQAFRIECKTFPLLHQKGNNGQYYTQEEIKALIKYASDRGVQIVPEFDIPGHTTAWLTAYPEFASLTIPQKPETGYGVFKPVMNPTNEKLYKHLDLFFKEMSVLFPSEYIHIGGDEVRSDDWLNNPNIKKFMKKKGYTTVPQLQNYFNARVEKILTKYNKKVIGWDEILEGKPSKGTIIQAWRGEQHQREAIAQGYGVIRSYGFYIDQTYTAGEYYARFDTLNSPLYLGGEGAMWSELVDSITLESRLWPNAAAIAEMYWRHPKQIDTISFYRRLLIFTFWNASLDPIHSDVTLLTERGEVDYNLLNLFSYVTPLNGYKRHKMIKAQGAYNSSYKLNTYADVGRPTSSWYLFFVLKLNTYINTPTEENREILESIFFGWRKTYSNLNNGKNLPEGKEELGLIILAFNKTGEAGNLWLEGNVAAAREKLSEARAVLAGKEYELSVFKVLEEAMK